MDAALPPTLSSQDLVSQSDNASANVGAGLSTPAPIPAPSQQTGVAPNTVQNSGDPVATPVKRKPGRPKGSVKKLTPGGEALGPANKIKRPVGRPRKDGLPAGSVTSGVRSRPRKSAPERLGGSNAKPANMSSQLTSAAFGVPQPGVRSLYHHCEEHTDISTKPTFRPYYPPNQMPGQAHYQTTFSASVGMQPSVSAPPIVAISNSNGSGPVVNSQLAYHIDPALDRDDWANLARTNHCALLQALLIALAAPNPVSTVGPSVEEAFKSHLISLAPNAAQKDSQPIPALYSILKTFWLPSSPAYFSLTASASTARTPSEHRFLYWDPQPLVFNGIACPVCSTPLINRGRIRSGPMKVYDLEKPFFIVGCEYVCKSPVCVANVSAEGRKFASTDQSILRSLPSRLRDEFPAHLMQGSGDLGSSANFWNWQATGVSGSLWNMVKGCLKCGMPRDAILTLINAIQHGTPDEQGAGEEEEEGEEGEEEDQLDQDQSMPQAAAQSAASALTTDGKKDVRFISVCVAVLNPCPSGCLGCFGRLQQCLESS